MFDTALPKDVLERFMKRLAFLPDGFLMPYFPEWKSMTWEAAPVYATWK